MALTTRIPGHIIIADDPTNIVFGTCSLGDAFGTVISATVKRAADIEELNKCGGNLLALVMTKLRFELTLKVVFSASVDVELAKSIVFPLAGVNGRMTDLSFDYEEKGQQMLTIEAKSFDSLSVGGQGYAYSFYGSGGVSDPGTLIL